MIMRIARVFITLASAVMGGLAVGFVAEGNSSYPFGLCLAAVTLFACLMWSAE